jgi:hypothetical protein
MNGRSGYRWFLGLGVLLGLLAASCASRPPWTQIPATPTGSTRPVLWYCLYFNAPGENRYTADGAYSNVIAELRKTFDVRISDERPTFNSLVGINAVLIANPNDQAFGTNSPPHHMDLAEIDALLHYVERGGGVIVMGNQENHNLEIDAMNRLLGRWGMQFVNRYTDAKLLILPSRTPVLGGLRWAYYTGNQVAIAQDHPAKPSAWVMNDLSQPPKVGPRDEPGCLLARAHPGRGRVVVVTDSGWVGNNALEGRPVGDVVIEGHDNLEIFKRVLEWAAGRRN